MILWRYLSGISEAGITGADPGKTLGHLNASGIALHNIHQTDVLTIRFQCSRKDKQKIADICRKRGDDIRFYRETGLPVSCKAAVQRPVLMLGLLLLFTLTLFLPTRVLFLRVEGNTHIPERMILEAAEDCGILFGASRRAVRSEKMKNQLLEALPELKWAGINTSGCTAVISVREHPVQEDKTVSAGICNVVAARDGRITSCTVTRGTGLCAAGDVVQKGQLLISGYTDCGICIRATAAEGEVFAETIRETTIVSPICRLARGAQTGTQRKFTLILGKKRINLWKGSGISDPTCGRMYQEYCITLPGGYQLPVKLTVETLLTQITEPVDRISEISDKSMQEYSGRLILESSVAGSILRAEYSSFQHKGLNVLKGSYICSEMIGRVITEEIGETNGKTD